MTPPWVLHHEDCLKAMSSMGSESVDSIVTDPPAGIAFMGKEWDKDKGGRDAWVAWMTEVARECFRVIKPGGHALVWALPRTSHWTGWAWESAGWEPRDKIVHLFGSGFPKSLDVSKAIDAAAGAEREVVGRRTDGRYAYGFDGNAARPTGGRVGTDDAERIGGFVSEKGMITAPATEAARQWSGWGTALKPAAEDWWVFRKPLVGTVAANMTAHGTGGLNIDGCRIAGNVDEMRGRSGTAQVGNQILGAGIHNPAGGIWEPSSAGRWPANVILDGEAAAMLDAQTGTLTSGIPGRRRKPHETTSMAGTVGMLDRNEVGYADSGGASRFFLRVGSRDFSTDDESCEKTPTCLPIESGSPNRFFYTAKASRSERTHGGDVENLHPTVKPIALMRWLVRLVTPPGGLVLDPFCGSGSTGVGAILEGFNFVGSEADLESAKTSRARLELATLVRVGGVKNPWEDDPAVTVPEGPPSLISSIDDLFGFGE